MTIYCEDCGQVLGASPNEVKDTIFCEDCAPNHGLEVGEEGDEIEILGIEAEDSLEKE